MRAVQAVLAVTLLAALPGAPRAEVIEEIVAKVNDEIITKSELENEEQMLVAELYRSYTGEELDREVDRARASLLQNLIDRKILLHRAEHLYDLDKIKGILLESFMEQQDIDGRRELERLLAQEGMTVTELEARLLEIYAPNEILKFEVSERVAVGDKEVEAYYEEHPEEFRIAAEAEVREIVLLAGEADRTERRAEAERLRARLVEEGADFAEMAREHSDAGTAPSGGLLAPVGRGDLAEPLDEAAFTLPVGTVSPVLETDHGFCLVKVESRREASKRPLDEVREGLRAMLEQRRRQEALDEYLSKARREAEIWVSPDYRDRYRLMDM